MATASIPLAKGLDLSKMEWPAYLSIKKDGVPIKITVNKLQDCYSYTAISRDNKPLGGPATDVGTFFMSLAQLAGLRDGEHVFVFEITHETITAFKDISGTVKRKEPQDGLIYNLFDYWWSGYPDATFINRIVQGAHLVRTCAPDNFRVIEQETLVDVSDAGTYIAYMQEMLPDEEGFILSSGNRTFKPNSRHWDYQKVVVDPMHDLEVVGFEEAISKEGEPLGMVGRINVMYNGKKTGCGPGKMTHAERKGHWADRGVFLKVQTNIATIKAKRDPSYTGLRQPTFQHWRFDKTEPNEEVIA
jgi:hypothetical protein